jgi:RNA polymerase sigma-70 factor (sigma-E family)
VPDPRRVDGAPTAPGTDAEASLQAVFDREWAPMVRLATLLLAGDQRHAEEVVQDALLGLHRAWGRLADTDRSAGYLRRSVVNGCRSAHRRRLVEERHLRAVSREESVPGSVADDTAEHDRVFRVLRGLPVRQREVLVLRYWQDATEAEIARTLGISAGAVKTHAHRGLAALRAELTGTTDPTGTGNSDA